MLHFFFLWNSWNTHNTTHATPTTKITAKTTTATKNNNEDNISKKTYLDNNGTNRLKCDWMKRLAHGHCSGGRTCMEAIIIQDVKKINHYCTFTYSYAEKSSITRNTHTHTHTHTKHPTHEWFFYQWMYTHKHYFWETKEYET